MTPFGHVDPQSLPCHHCPYGGACCTYGVNISLAEKVAIVARFGADAVYRTENGRWRTAVRAGHCIFQADDGRCTIHGEDFYPAECRAYPWYAVTADGDTYTQTDDAYVHPYECPAMVLAALDAKFRQIARRDARYAQTEALIIQLVPHIDTSH